MNSDTWSKYSFMNYFQRLFPHVGTLLYFYCGLCGASIQKEGLFCHGSENTKEFVMTDIGKQLRSKFKCMHMYNYVSSIWNVGLPSVCFDTCKANRGHALNIDCDPFS